MTQAFQRSFDLEDISIRAGGTGRTVVAYAATFGAPYEVTDYEGHYLESIARTGFDRSTSQGVARFACLFNHGMTVHQTPSERHSMPLGTPLEVRADARGLLTVTEYANTPLADEVLELIRAGSIRSQSFSGRWIRSRTIAAARAGDLRTIERTEVALREYGPCTFPVNADAEIVGVRTEDPATPTTDLAAASVLRTHRLAQEQRRRLLSTL